MDQMDFFIIAFVFALVFFIILTYCFCLITLFWIDEGESDDFNSDDTRIKTILPLDIFKTNNENKEDISWI